MLLLLLTASTEKSAQFYAELNQMISNTTHQQRVITTRCTGGIGNRLFQIAAAIKYAEEFNRNPILLLPCLARSEHGNFTLLFELFPEIPLVESAPSWKPIKDSPKHTHDPILVLNGFFQDLKFFPPLTSPLLPRLPSLAPLIKNNNVAIHFRFGDYTILPHHQVNLSSYYMEAIRRFPPLTTFFLFSDSPEKLKAISSELWAKDIPNTIKSTDSVLETFQEIANCSLGFIGSNSTFAWWAAFLAWNSSGRQESYKAYFPDTWMPEGQPNHKPNLFTLPYTVPLSIQGSADNSLKSFSYL